MQKYQSDVLIFTSSVPEGDPCSSGSTGVCTVQRAKEAPQTRIGTAARVPYSTTGIQRDLPMKEARLKLLGPASYVIHNAIHGLLVLFLLRWNFSSCSLHHPYILRQVTISTTQRYISGVLESSLAAELTTLSSSHGYLAQIPYF